jgi:hypothetical protein
MTVRDMDENAVKVIVQAGFDTYEEKTGLPRHNENLKNFEKLFGAANWIKGAAWAFVALNGLNLILKYVK